MSDAKPTPVVEVGATYRTKHGVWTVTRIWGNGTFDATKGNNGIRARLWMPDFVGWDIERIDPISGENF